MDVRNSTGKLVSLLNSSSSHSKGEGRHTPKHPRLHRDQQEPNPVQKPRFSSFSHQNSRSSHTNSQPSHQNHHHSSTRHSTSHSHGHSPASSISSSSSSTSQSGSGSGSRSLPFSSPSAAASSTIEPFSSNNYQRSLNHTSTSQHHPYTSSSPHDLSLTLPSLAISDSPPKSRHALTLPSLSRTDSSETRTTLSPSPVTTPQNSSETYNFRSTAQRTYASSHPLSKLPAVAATEARPIVLAPLSLSSQVSHSSLPQTTYFHRRVPLQSVNSYSSGVPSNLSTPMDQYQAMPQASPATLQMPDLQMNGFSSGLVGQNFFNGNSIPAPSHTLQSPSASSSTTPKQKPTQKKNSYPCPVAKQYGCNEYFTTSGHAARHAKKHTGKKDAICPECSKAFTRKDNMEQHRRTHAGPRAAAKAVSAAASSTSHDESRKRLKVEKQKKSNDNAAVEQLPMPSASPSLETLHGLPIPSSFDPSPVLPLQMNDMGLLDPRLIEGLPAFNPADASSFLSTSFQQQMPGMNIAPTSRPSLHRSSYQDNTASLPKLMAPAGPGVGEFVNMNMGDSPVMVSPSVAPALDALALAASRQ